MHTQVAPGLLLSMPQLLDPNFARAVVLMVEHSDEGSFGLIINRPSDLAVADVLEQLDIAWRGRDDAVVWSGGPVTPSTGWLLHEPLDRTTSNDDDARPMSIAPGIALSTSPALLHDIAAAPPDRVRFLLGYAGWGPGQLAGEMVHGAWLHVDATPQLVFDTAADAMWESALHTLGIEPESLIPGVGVQ